MAKFISVIYKQKSEAILENGLQNGAAVEFKCPS